MNDTKHFRAQYLNPAIDSGLVELTIPDKPKSVNQKYRKVKRI
ncbi:MAG: Fic family protein [Phocaeicola sp.]